MISVRHPKSSKNHPHAPRRCICGFLLVLLCIVTLSSCNRAQLRQIINKLGSPDKEKPEIYHEFEGYSPGAKKNKGKEDFNRYHYYIAPERNDMVDNDPDIYFRQDYEVIDPIPTFDEEQYWRDHPITIEDNSPSETTTE